MSRRRQSRGFQQRQVSYESEDFNRGRKMWQLIAIVLIAVMLFYLGAFYLTVAAWLNAVGHLLRGNFIRASIWACIGFGMLCWWQGENTIPDPWDFHAWLTNSAWVVGIGALGTFARFYNRHRRAVPAVTPFEPTGAQYQYQTRHQPARGPPCGAR